MTFELHFLPRLAAGLLTVLFSAACYGADEETVTDEQMEALVNDLVSPNQAPRTGLPNAKYPAGYDHEAQKRVRRAFHKLRELAPRSFPFLFDHFDDKRYSLTADSGDTDKNYTVGKLCRDILASHLQSDEWDHKEGGTSFRSRPSEPDYLAHYKLFQAEHAKKWWAERKDKSLRELQLEVLEWVLAEETAAPEKYSDAQRERAKKRLNDLRESKSPLKPGFPFAK
jgi:hypothetical protein